MQTPCPVRRLSDFAREFWRREIGGVCSLCHLDTDGGRICSQCLRILPWNDHPCDCCGQPLNTRQPDGIVCEACQARPPPFVKARAPLIYDFPVDAVIKAIKFRRQLSSVPAFSELLLDTLQREFTDIDALAPVPLHHWRQMRRGFNQAMELCRPLRRTTGLPLVMQARRVRATAAQAGLNARERKKNLKGAFALSGRLACRHPLIVDDVVTTGETCSEFAIALLESGARSVSVLSVARAYAGTTGLNV